MGQSQLNHAKRDIKRDVFLQFYQEKTSNQYFTFCRSNGFKNNPVQIFQRTPLPQLNSRVQELGVKRNEGRCVKKKISDSSTYPYSCIGLLLVQFEDGLRCGSGSLIGKNLVLTAASNIYDKETQKYATTVKFVLNINGQNGEVYEINKKMHFHKKYIGEAEGSHRYNYALLEIEAIPQEINSQRLLQRGVNELKSNPGLIHGYFGINTTFSGKEHVFLYGYSGQLNGKQQMEYHIKGEKIDTLICKHGSLGYKMESVPTETGSPIFIKRHEFYQIVGMHISGKKDLSCGLQFDQQIRQDINNWIVQVEGAIDLSSKGLTALEANLFTQFVWHNMTVINLDDNNIGCEGLGHLTKKGWPMLRELHLCKNNISKLKFDSSAIKNVQNLYLSDNNIKQVAPLTELPLLRVLSLSLNKIQNIDELFGLKYMQRLDLSSNKLCKLSTDIGRLGELKKLFLSRNELQCVPMQVLKLKELSVLAVDGNKLKTIPADMRMKLEHQNVEVIME